MIIGLSLPAFTLVHVVITFVAIASGFVVVFAMIGSHQVPKITALFWIMTVLTTVTGFMFFLSPTQAKMLTPATNLGFIATIVFLIGLFALYVKWLVGPWRWIYAVAATLSLYFNVFVLIVQAFNKVPLINPLAPLLGSRAGPPFATPVDFHFTVAQGITLVIFVMLGIIAVLKFRRGPGLVT